MKIKESFNMIPFFINLSKINSTSIRKRLYSFLK